MKQKKIMLSVVAISAIMSVSSADIVINDTNTTGVELNSTTGSKNIEVNTTGSIELNTTNPAHTAISVDDINFTNNIVNKGTIEVNATNDTTTASGIDINTTNKGSIVNENKIQLNSDANNTYAIYTRNNEGNITNDGDITINETNSSIGKLNAFGIYTEDNTGNIVNNGNIDINTTANTVVGIAVMDNNTSNAIINTGNINVVNNNESGQAVGIASIDSEKTNIVNEGNITSSGVGIIVLPSDNILDNMETNITNSGDIISNSYSIYVKNESNLSNSLNITNTGDLNSTDGYGLAFVSQVYNDGNASVNITNSGKIDSSRHAIIGVSKTNIGNAQVNITNTGDLNSTDGDELAFISQVYNDGNASVNITNSGKIDSSRHAIIGVSKTNIGNAQVNITNTGDLNSTDGYGLVFVSQVYNDGNASVNITNSGKITSSNYAIIGVSKTNIGNAQVNIINEGNLTSTDGDGLAFVSQVYNDGNASVNITNSGKINSNKTAIFGVSKTNIGNAQVNITNEGNLTSTDGYGIYAWSGTHEGNASVNITNSGKIDSNNTAIIGVSKTNIGNTQVNITNEGNLTSTDGDGIHAKFYVNNDGNASVNIMNSGKIDSNNTAINSYAHVGGTGNAKINITNTGDLTSTDGYGIYAWSGTHEGNASVNITNSGKIDSYDAAIYLTSYIDNNGTSSVNITNTGDLTSTDGYGMYVYSNPNNGNSLVNITNSGKIDSYYAAIYAYSNIRLNGTSKINITNTGDLNSTEGAGIVANSDTNKSSSTNIINNGNINAPIGIYTIAKSSEGNITVTIKNQKSIKASTAFKIDTKAYDTENVLIQNTGNIYADNIIQDDSENALIITNNNKTFENRGYVNGDFNNTTFDIQNYGKIALKTYNTSNVKSYTGEKDGELDINMKANENATLTYSKLHATNVTMEDGTKMFVNVKDMNVSMADRIDGKTLDGVVTSDNNITYNGNILVSDNSSLLDFNLSRNEQNISLNVITKKIGQVISNTGLSSLASVAKVLDNYKLGTNAELDTFKNNLYKLGTNEEVANAVASTTPIHVANISYMANVLNGLNTGAINSASGMNAGDRTIVEKNFWIKPFYSYIKQDNKDGSKGFAAHVKGVALGGDAKYNDESKLGLAFTYASTHQRTNDIDQRNNMDIYGLTAYGSMLVDSDTKLKGNVGINFYNVRSARAIETTTSIATANYTSYSINANAKVSRSYDINDEFKISPIVGLDYVRYHNPSYNETGAGGLNLHVDSFNENLLSAKVGSGFNYNIDNTSKVKFNIGASYDIVNNDDTVTASYAGNNASTFTTRGIKAPRFGYNAGVGYNKNITDTFSVNVGYNFERKSDFRNNQVEIKTNWKF